MGSTWAPAGAMPKLETLSVLALRERCRSRSELLRSPGQVSRTGCSDPTLERAGADCAWTRMPRRFAAQPNAPCTRLLAHPSGSCRSDPALISVWSTSRRTAVDPRDYGSYQLRREYP